MKTYLEYADEKSNKFWQIEVDGASHVVQYGKTGTIGQSKTKTFDSEKEAVKDAQKLIASKKNKGYQAVGQQQKATQPVAPPKRQTKSLKFSETQWKILEIEKSEEFKNANGAVLRDSLLIVIHGRHMKIWDMAQPQKPKLLSIFKSPDDHVHGHFNKLVENILYSATSTFDNQGILTLIDISHINNITQKKQIRFENDIHGMDWHPDHGLYVTTRGGIFLMDKNYSVKRLMQTTDCLGYTFSGDTVVYKNYLYRIHWYKKNGLFIYEIKPDGDIEQIAQHSKGYTPTHIEWLEPGKKMFLHGDHDSLPIYDVSVPHKPKRKKGINISRGHECYFVREGNELLMIRKDRHATKMTIQTFQINDQDEITLLKSKQNFKVEESTTKNVFFNGHYLFIVGMENLIVLAPEV